MQIQVEMLQDRSQKFITELLIEKNIEFVLKNCTDDIALFSNYSLGIVNGKDELCSNLFYHWNFLQEFEQLLSPVVKEKALYEYPKIMDFHVQILTQEIVTAFFYYYLTEQAYLQVVITYKNIGGSLFISQLVLNYNFQSQKKELEQKNLSERLQMVYDNIRGGIVRCKADNWLVVEANRFFYTLCDFDEEYFRQVYDTSFWALLSEKTRSELGPLVASVQIGESFEFSALMEFDGKKIHVLLAGELSSEFGQNFINILLTDTTSIYNSQLALKKKTKELALVCNTIPSLIFTCSCNERGSITFANQAFYEYFGYNKVSFLKEHHNELYGLFQDESSALAWKRLVEYHVQQINNIFTLEFCVCDRQGNGKKLRVKARRMYTENNDPFFYCIADDKTEIQQYEKSLEYARIKLQTAIKHLNILYWEYNPKTDQGTIYFFNEISQDVFQVDNFVEYVLTSEKINPEFHETFKTMHDQLRQGTMYVEANVIMEYKGSEMWRKIRYTNMFNAEGEPVLAIGTSEDINAYMSMKERLLSATDQTGVTVWTYDPVTKELTLEGEMESRFFIASREQNVPQSHIDSRRIFEDDIAVYLEFFDKILKGLETASCEVRCYNFQIHDYSWTRLKYSRISGLKDDEYRILGTVLDIAEQKRAEKLYNDQLQIWEMAQTDVYGSLICNITTGEIYASRIGDVEDIAPKNADMAMEYFKSYLIKDEHKELVMRYFDRDSIIRKYELGQEQGACMFQARLLDNLLLFRCELKVMKHYETGDLIGLISLHDVTRHVIRKEFVRLRLLHSVDFIYYIDIKNDAYQLWIDNKMISSEMLGNSSGCYSTDFIMFISRYVVEEDKERIIYSMSLPNLIARAKRTSSFEIGFRIVRRGKTTDEIRYKRFHVFRYDERAQTICIGAVDITKLHIEEKRKNDELYQALEAARRANKAKDTFLASMSHDLRTPMNAIIGMTSLALKDVLDKKQVEESLNIIKTSSAYLLNLLNNILDMAKIESGKMTIANAMFSITKSLNELCDVFKASAQQKNIRYIVNCENIRHDRVISDETCFSRIISNVISNAVKFTPQYGCVYVSLEEEMTVRHNIANFVITVQDSGIGISNEQIQYIFDPFHRVESSMISKIEGSGLGLAIVKVLVENLGGTISVTSHLDVGTTFTIKLPMVVEKNSIEENSQNKKTTLLCDFTELTVLLIEDHPINIVVIKKMLEKIGIKVTVARDGKEGAETFIDSGFADFDFIFMDLQMPVMNGYEATEYIRSSAHPRAKSVPIIALTANAFEDDIKKCFEAGMTGHIAKPVSMEKLVNTVAELMSE